MPLQPTTSLIPGLTLEADVTARNGRFLIPKGQVIAPRHIDALFTWGVEAVPVMNGASPPTGPGLDPDPQSTPPFRPASASPAADLGAKPLDCLLPCALGSGHDDSADLATLARNLPRRPEEDDPARQAAYLEQAHGFALRALRQAAALGDFHASITRQDGPERILEETRKRIAELVDFQAVGLFLMNEDESRFEPALADPEAAGSDFEALLHTLVRNGRIAEMIWDGRPVRLDQPGGRRVLLHLIRTTARVRGLFMGVLPGQDRALAPEVAALLGNVLQHTANALESSQLYALITRQNQELQARVEAKTAELRQTVRDLKREIAQRRIVQDNLAVVFDNVHDAILIYRHEGEIIDVNEKMLSMFGIDRPRARTLAVPRDISCSRRIDDQCFEAWNEVHAAGATIFEWTVHAPGSGTNFPVEVFLKRITWNDQPAVLATLRDISQRKEAEKQLEFLALHDPLTGIPNRKLFLDRLDQAITQARRGENMVAVLFIDLDGFKPVNDTHGHDVGDGVLIIMARRLRQALRKSDTVARLGGDEFGVVVTDLATETDHHLVMDKVYETVRQPVTFNGITLNLDCSIGAALFPADGQTVDALIKVADTEMYGVKKGKR